MLRPIAGCWRLAAIAALAALSLAGSARGEQAAPAPPVESTEESIAALAAELASLRGIAAPGELDVVVAEPEEIRARISALAERAERANRQVRRDRAIARFGLPGGEPGEVPGEVPGESKDELAYFDEQAGRLYVVRGAGDEPAVVREVARAVLGRHVERDSIVAAARTRDAAAARWALWEGDAAAMALARSMARGAGLAWGAPATETMLRGAGESRFQRGEAATSAYRAGLSFLAHHLRHQPWSRIDVMYQRPPRSTSHVLHPELYERYERPRTIAAKGVGLDRFYRLVYDDVQGELELRNWLIANGVSAERAARAARGWRGDRLAVYAPVSRLGGAWSDLGVLKTSWRTEIDAVEFFEAAARALASLAGGAPVASGGDRVEYRSPGGDHFTVERRGDAVVVLAGSLSSWQDDIRRAVWAWGSESP